MGANMSYDADFLRPSENRGQIVKPDEVSKVGYKWTVNFGQCYDRKQVGEYANSSVFLDDQKRKCQFVLFPRGDSEENLNYVSLYVEVIGHSDESFNFWFWLSLIDIHGNEVHKNLFTDKQSSLRVDGKAMWGFPRFIHCDKILGTNSTLLHEYNNIKISYEPCLDSDYEKTLIDCKDRARRCLLCHSKPKIYTDYETLLKNQRYSDVTLVSADKVSFPVHKSILSARSPYFAMMFENEAENEKSMVIEDVRSEVLQQLLNYIYTCGVDKAAIEKADNVSLEIFVAADKYGFDDLKDIWELTMRDKITTDNAMELLVFADKYDAQSFKTTVMRFLIKNAKEIIDHSSFKTVERSHPKLVAELCRVMALQN